MSERLLKECGLKKGEKVLHISMMGSPCIRTLTVEDVETNADSSELRGKSGIITYTNYTRNG